MSEFRLDPIPDAIEAFKNGEFVIVVDDEDRENEGDLICASSLITPEKVNFMTIHARGLICISLSEKRCEELELHMMSNQNTSFHSTQFTVSVDVIQPGVTTGISAHDRAMTILALTNEKTKPEDLGRLQR